MNKNKVGRKLFRFCVLAVIVALAGGALSSSLSGRTPAATAGPDASAVLQWNMHASNAIVVVAGQPPHVSLLSFAMVQGAVYDAVNAIEGGYQPYLVSPPADGTESVDAAVAAAAFNVLADLFPSQEPDLQDLYDSSLDLIPDGASKTAGIAIGEAAAAAMIDAREDDGRGGPGGFNTGTEPGEWRPTPPGFVNDPAAWIADVLPFLMQSPDQFRSKAPDSLNTGSYTKDFNEVKEVGAIDSTTRTDDQTEAARFWGAFHPPALWNQIFRAIAADRGLDSAGAARMLAMTSLAGADGIIACWDSKAHWIFWRPSTAIHEAANDGNRHTEPDPDWEPLLPNPPYPDHPSGHTCVSGAFVETLRSFFGTHKISFSMFSPGSGTERSFTRLDDVIDEIIDARVWAGIHFRTADVDGAVIGKDVAKWLRKHYFQPVR